MNSVIGIILGIIFWFWFFFFWYKWRQELKRRHRLERILMNCRQQLMIEREARQAREKGLPADSPRNEL